MGGMGSRITQDQLDKRHSGANAPNTRRDLQPKATTWAARWEEEPMSKPLTAEDEKLFAEAASSYLATLEHVEATLPDGVGQFSPAAVPAHRAAGERVVRLSDR